MLYIIIGIVIWFFLWPWLSFRLGNYIPLIIKQIERYRKGKAIRFWHDVKCWRNVCESYRNQADEALKMLEDMKLLYNIMKTKAQDDHSDKIFESKITPEIVEKRR